MRRIHVVGVVWIVGMAAIGCDDGSSSVVAGNDAGSGAVDAAIARLDAAGVDAGGGGGDGDAARPGVDAALDPDAGPSPTDLDSLGPGRWFQVPSSSIEAVMYDYGSRYFGNTRNMRFLVESGASYDSTRDRMIVWGGGHQDYAGNELYVFDIQTLRWSRINDPAPRFDEDGLIEDSGYYPDATGAPDLQQPRSRHSYWYAIYVPAIDRYCSIGASFTFPHAHSSEHVDCFDFTVMPAGRWEQKRDAIAFNGLASATYDPVTRHVWAHGLPWDATLGRLAEWDPVADVWTSRSTGPSGIRDRSAPALDTRRHRLVYLGGGQLRYFDLDASGMLTPELVTMTGATEILEMERGGFAYDTVNDKLVAWAGDASLGLAASDIFVIDPETWACTRVTLSGAPPRLPHTFSSGGSNGVYGRFAYIPTEGAFILINNDVSDDVFFFKLPPT